MYLLLLFFYCYNRIDFEKVLNIIFLYKFNVMFELFL